MDGLIGVAGIVAGLLVTGVVIGLARPGQFSLRWLLAAAGLVLLNDVMLTSGYGLIPSFLPHGGWNWQGKALALAATLAVAALPAFGWRASGLTLRQAPHSLRPALLVAFVYAAFFTALALAFPGDPASTEALAFQLTMPGLEEEPFYRGVLLFALGRAFTGRVSLLGVEWGWGAVLSCALFGMVHAFDYSGGAFHFDLLTMALTALPSFIAVWIVLKTRSVLLPVILHNFGNAITLLI